MKTASWKMIGLLMAAGVVSAQAGSRGVTRVQHVSEVPRAMERVGRPAYAPEARRDYRYSRQYGHRDHGYAHRNSAPVVQRVWQPGYWIVQDLGCGRHRRVWQPGRYVLFSPPGYVASCNPW